jgi:UDP-N-acetyl-D-glucosamine dehydrogenase
VLPSTEHLHLRLAGKTAMIAIIGLNQMGVEFAQCLSSVGFKVLGFEVDAAEIDRKQDQQESVATSHGADAPTELLCVAERTRNPARLREPDVLVLCLPTTLTSALMPDLGPLTLTARTVAKHLRPEHLVIVAGPAYPGITRGVVLRELNASGLVSGRDYHLACGPQLPGTISNPRFPNSLVVGGLDAESADLASVLFGHVIPGVDRVSTLETAEACLVVGEICQTVSSALANELKVTLEQMGVDIWEVISRCGVGSRFGRFIPGPGDCSTASVIFAWAARKYGLFSRMLEAAAQVNALMPTFFVEKVVDALNDVGKAVRGSRIAVLGMASEKTGDYPGDSRGIELLHQLMKKGAIVAYNDPHTSELPRNSLHTKMSSTRLTHEFLGEQDAVLIYTADSDYDWDWIVSHARLIIDTRNATRNVISNREKIVQA